MTSKTLVLSILIASVPGLPLAGCKHTPEEPDDDTTTGEEVEHDVKQGADDTSDAIDEAGEDLDDESK